MSPITFLTATAYLLDDQPNWESDVALDAELLTEVEVGLRQPETRRPLSETLRLALTYTAVVQGAALTTLRNSLQALTTERVLCPLWAYPIPAGATPGVTGAYYVCLGDGLAPEIKAHAELPFARSAFPLMVGRLGEMEDPPLATDEVAEVEFSFIENDVYPLSFPAVAPPNGLTTAGGVRPLCPWRPNWRTDPKGSHAFVELQREEIGMGRKMAEAFYPQPSTRTMEQRFTFSEIASWQFLRWFSDLAANVKTFWLPAALSEARLTANVLSTGVALAVDSPASRGNNTAMLLDDLVNRTPVKVTGTTGSNWNLGGQVGTAYEAAVTRIESLVLVRFAKSSVRLHFAHPETAEMQSKFVEVPWEVEGVAGETFGMHYGALPATAYIYTFTIEFPGAMQTWRYTGWERDVSEGGNSYAAQFFEHGSIRETTTLDRHETTLKSRYFSGSPLGLFIPFRLEWPLMVEIAQVDVGTGGIGSNKHIWFYGEVIRVEGDGPFFTAACKALGPLMSRAIPKRAFTPTCPYVVFLDPDCGLGLDDWKWQGEVVSYDASTRVLTLENVARVSGAAVTLTANYFAGGYCYFGAGQNVQHRGILSDTAPGNVLLVLATSLTTPPSVGTVVTMHPGCNGRYTQCIGKFNNGPRFGGFPFMPIGNPSMIKVSKNAGGAKK